MLRKGICNIQFDYELPPYLFNSTFNTSLREQRFTFKTIDFEHEESFAGTCEIKNDSTNLNDPCYFYMKGRNQFHIQFAPHPFTTTTKLRNFYTNTFNAGKYLQFDSENSYIITNLILVTQLPLKPLNTKIQNMVFGLTQNDYYILYSHYTNNQITHYQIQCFKSMVYQKSIALPLSEIHDELRFDNDYVYISFAKNIYIFDRNLNFKNQISLPTATNTSLLDITSNSIYFCISYNNLFNCYSKQNYSTIFTQTWDSNIVQIKFISYWILISSENSINQYDYQEKTPFTNITLSGGSHYSLGYSLSYQKFFLFKSQPQTNKFILQYQYTDQFLKDYSTSIYCKNTYTIITNYCIKNSTAYQEWKNTIFSQFDGGQSESPQLPQQPLQPEQSYQPEQPQQPQQPQQPSQPFSLEEPEQPQEIQPGQEQHESQSQIEQCNSWINQLNQQVIGNVSQQLGKTLAFASFKIAPNFLQTFTCFLDDIWLYKYHSYDYSKSVKFLMETVDMMNYVRLDPWFLKSMQYFQETKVCNEKNQQRVKLLNYGQNSPQKVYFLNSAEDTYKNNLLVNCFFLFIFKLLYWLLKKLNGKKHEKNSSDFQRQKIMQFVHSHKKIQKPLTSLLTRTVSNLRQSSKAWTIFPAVLQANMLKLTFDCFIQLLSTFQFDFIDKLNLITTIFLLFCLVIYCFGFYSIIFSFENKKGSSNLLTTTKYTFKSFYFESIYFVFRNFIRGFIHSFFISNYSSQIVLLFVTDLFFITVCVCMRNCFEFKIIAFFNIMYSVCFGCFDLFFTLKVSHFDISLKQWNEDHVGFVLVVILVAVSLMISLTLLFMLIKEMILQIVDFCKRRNERSILPLKDNGDFIIKQNKDNGFFIQLKVKKTSLNERKKNEIKKITNKFQQQQNTQISDQKKNIHKQKQNLFKFENHSIKQKNNIGEFKNLQKEKKSRKLRFQQTDKPNNANDVNERYENQSAKSNIQITFRSIDDAESKSDFEQIDILTQKNVQHEN